RRRAGQEPEPRQPNIKPKASAKRPQKEKKPFPNPFKGIWEFFCDRRTHAVLGVGLICLALYIVVTAISFLRYGGADQSVVTSMDLPEIVVSGAKVENHGGPLGAALAQSVFAQGLGLGSLALIVYLAVIGLGLMGIRKCRFWSATFKTLLVGISTSVVLGLASLWLGLDVNLGGTHGRYVNILIQSYANWIGALIVSLLLITAVVYVYINDLLTLYNKYAAIRRARRERAEQERLEQEEARQRAREAMENSELNSEHEAAPAEEAAEDPFVETQPLEEVGFDESPREAYLDYDAPAAAYDDQQELQAPETDAADETFDESAEKDTESADEDIREQPDMDAPESDEPQSPTTQATPPVRTAE
ncbi:MAG: DNA translocase FtsK 4TM domain-containing protein, partial [Muribaculaceae bacterium]|nr:DNA translocase FtsK 4TM domain-containing protein [Muribaculaceae bacterium]